MNTKEYDILFVFYDMNIEPVRKILHDTKKRVFLTDVMMYENKVAKLIVYVRRTLHKEDL